MVIKVTFYTEIPVKLNLKNVQHDKDHHIKDRPMLCGYLLI